MRSVKIDREELLDILQKNREQHVKDYNEALVGYREDAIKELNANLAEAMAGKEIKHHISVIRPTSYEDSYNTVIRMLELSIDSSIELTMQEFQQYVEDKWSWKDAFTSTTAFYAAKKFA